MLFSWLNADFECYIKLLDDAGDTEQVKKLHTPIPKT